MDKPRVGAPIPIPRPRRLPRLRIGVGGLMLVILLVGLWLGDRVGRARQQRLAVEIVRAAGGFVRYADEFAIGPVAVPEGDSWYQPSWGKLTPGQKPTAPDWLRNWLGDEYCREITHVSTFVDIHKGSMRAPKRDQQGLDAALLALAGQSSVRTLQIGGGTVTDKGLTAVASLTGLEEFWLWWGGEITDDGVAHLARLPRLRVVNISLPLMTDAGIAHLASLPSLEQLVVKGDQFTDGSLKSLGRAKRLRVLILEAETGSITDAGLRHLEGLRHLRRLVLPHAAITPAARERLLRAIPGLDLEIVP